MKQITHIHEILPYTYNAIAKKPDGTIIEKQLIKGKACTYKVIYNGDVTIVILDDGSKGVSKRNPKDIYNRQIAHDIAHKRARIDQLSKEIDQLYKTGKTENRRVNI